MMNPGFLTYASFSKDGRGGWQVGEVDGLSQQEVDALVAWTPTRIDSGEAVPKYPSNEEIAAFTRRTAWLDAPWGHGDKVLFYSTPAGEDSSGRSGNVFSQVYVFRAEQIGRSRPSDLLNSPDFAQPFGAVAVNSAPRLAPVNAVTPGPFAAAETIANWLFDDQVGQQRRRTLVAINDALHENRQVVLCTEPADAAVWIAAVCATLSPLNAAHFRWSTLERARNLDQAATKGIDLACVPTGDYTEAMQHPGWVVVSSGLVSGQSITDVPVTSIWAQLTELVLADRSHFIAAAQAPAPLDSNDHEVGTALANYVAQHPELLDQTSAQMRAFVNQTQAQLLESGNPWVMSSTSSSPDNPFDVPFNSEEPASVVNTAMMAMAEVPAWTDAELTAAAEHQGPNLPAAVGSGKEWLDFGDILRIRRSEAPDYDPFVSIHQDLISKAQYSVLVSAALAAAHHGLTPELQALPWWRAEQLNDDEIELLSSQLAAQSTPGQLDELRQQAMPTGLQRICNSVNSRSNS